ncbi:MAG: hypothetical protein ACD_21C00011G0013 [uncultured bacterium]|nr:MAG: hypothetical protein ACD_21C00011G0013 [uncultured bacterium]
MNMQTKILIRNTNSHKIRNSLFYLTAFLVSIFLCQFSYAKEIVINGSATLEDVALKSLTENGSLTFNNLTIEDKLRVNGSVNGKKLKCKEFKINGGLDGKNIEATKGHVNGSLDATDIKVTEELTVNGQVLVKNGDLGSVVICGRDSKLINSKIKDVFVKKGDGGVQVLELGKKTVVSGDVVFESGEGKIYLSGSSEVLGDIKGATVIKK